MTAEATVSIIVPILNEANNLPRLFASMHRLKPLPQQVILIDGGSSDHSVRIAKETIKESTLDNHKINWQIIESKAGRAMQMNAGAALATSDIFLFLHADTQLPPQAIAGIKTAMQKLEWGRFDVRLNSHQPMLWLVSKMINLRSRLSSIATGDRSGYFY